MNAVDMTAIGSLGGLWEARVRATPTRRAYQDFREGAWRTYAWADMAFEVGRVRAALIHEGLRPGDRVGICARNSARWVICDMAVLSLGLVLVPLFFNDRPENLVFCLEDSGTKLLFVDQAPAPLVRALPLRRIVGLTEEAHDTTNWSSWCAAHTAPPAAVARDDLATIVYTSGTTGRPKGVMLTHGNILANCAGLMDAVREVVAGDHRFLSFLPLSHMFERTTAHFIGIAIGAETVFARGIAELPDDLRTARPTLLVSVPKIFERTYARMQAVLAQKPLMARLLRFLVAQQLAVFRGEARRWQRLAARLLDGVLGKRLRAPFGGRLQYVFLGGAPAQPALLAFFVGIGLRFLQGYGLTEAAPVLTCNRVGDRQLASVGRPLPHVELRFADGELCARGPNIMRGYWANAQATAAVIDAEGFLHTGDLGRMEAGEVYLTGRLKDIIVLSNGEKIAPADAEQAILMDPAFEQVLVVGEGRGSLGLLAVTRLADVHDIMERANRQLHAFPGYARIHHAAVLTEPWTIENDLLTPTLKPRRQAIEARYRDVIDALYGGP
ncbi:MAG: long-chain fatty acid--CoA ligase [Gammaproteobacteria bacterium]|nr:long-chain fatty acid--CoA ligase [Gammaproteobacteria bacterium]